MRNIGDLYGKHEREEAWIFGKGPNLDLFDMESAGALRICINESVLVVPDPTYFFSHDERPIRNVGPQWPRGCRAVLHKQRVDFAASSGIPPGSVLAYAKLGNDRSVREMSAEQIRDRSALCGHAATAISAIQFCRLIHASSISLVGFDGTEHYAECLGLNYEGKYHARHRLECESFLRVLGIPHRFLGYDGHL